MTKSTATIMRKKKLHWVPLVFITAYHVALFVALPIYLLSNAPSAAMLGLTFALWTATLTSITAGYHRLYSHVTYRTRRLPEAFFLFFATVSGQGSALKWSHDHRLHHRFGF